MVAVDVVMATRALCGDNSSNQNRQNVMNVNFAGTLFSAHRRNAGVLLFLGGIVYYRYAYGDLGRCIDKAF